MDTPILNFLFVTEGHYLLGTRRTHIKSTPISSSLCTHSAKLLICTFNVNVIYNFCEAVVLLSAISFSNCFLVPVIV